MINTGSYLARINYEPDFLKQLNISFLYYLQNRNIVVCEYLSSMDIKFGLMLFARNSLEHSVKKDQVLTHYHLVNFIYNTKAFLDTIANILNYVYALGLTGSKIDLSDKRFIHELKKENNAFLTNISDLRNWFKNVKKWRDDLIHQKSQLIAFMQSHEPKNGDLSKMTRRPMSWIEMIEILERNKAKKRKYKIPEQDIFSFCEKWVINSEKLMGKLSNILPTIQNPDKIAEV